jgi:hypothetical protein
MKKMAILRFIGLWVSLTAASALASILSGIGHFIKLDAQQVPIAGALSLVVTLAYTGIAAFVASKSTWRGLKLVSALFAAFFGINGFLAQIESLVFLKQLVNILPDGMLFHIVLNSALLGAALAVLTPLFYGKLKGPSETNPDSGWLRMPVTDWVWKLSLIGVAYVIIYLAFGALVAKPIAGEVFSQYYAGLKLPVWFIPFQFARGLVWAATAIPILFLMRGTPRDSGMTIGIMFALFIGIIMIVPNPLFPDQMRIGHLVELLTSSFVLGWTVVLILTIGRNRADKMIEGKTI